MIINTELAEKIVRYPDSECYEFLDKISDMAMYNRSCKPSKSTINNHDCYDFTVEHIKIICEEVESEIKKIKHYIENYKDNEDFEDEVSNWEGKIIELTQYKELLQALKNNFQEYNTILITR